MGGWTHHSTPAHREEEGLAGTHHPADLGVQMKGGREGRIERERETGRDRNSERSRNRGRSADISAGICSKDVETCQHKIIILCFAAPTDEGITVYPRMCIVNLQNKIYHGSDIMILQCLRLI